MMSSVLKGPIEGLPAVWATAPPAPEAASARFSPAATARGNRFARIRFEWAIIAELLLLQPSCDSSASNLESSR